MQSHEVLREAAEKVGVKALATRLRLSQALIYKWCEASEADDPDGSGTRNPLDRIREIVRFTGHIPIVQWLCHEAGGFFVFNPDTRSQDVSRDLLLSTQHLVRAFSELLNKVSESVADDGFVEHNEAEHIREEWQQLKTTAETFVVACEQGVYRMRKE